MRAMLAALALAAGAASAHEDLSDHMAGGAIRCTFVMECYELEGCAEADYNIDVLLAARAAGARIVTPAETLRGGATRRPDGSVTVGADGEGGLHLLTVSAGGNARLAVHLIEGPVMVNYLGFCEALE